MAAKHKAPNAPNAPASVLVASPNNIDPNVIRINDANGTTCHNNNIINLPTAATTNPGLYYDFIVLTAVGGSTSTIVNIAGSGGQFVGALSLAGGTAANAVLDVAGDAFTFVSSTVIGSRARITCLTDDGTDGVWQVESLASPIATID